MSNLSNPVEPLLSEAKAAFIQRHIAINMASRDAEHRPSVARAYGCRVAADRRQVTVFLSVPAAQPLLNDVRGQRLVAVVFSRPSTHETIQLKGSDARIEALRDGDVAVIDAYLASFLADLRSVGYVDPFASNIERNLLRDFVAVTFTPTAAFEQTPGPNAGRKLGS